MATTTIRVPVETRDRLNALAHDRGTSAGELVTELVRAADDQQLLVEAERSWARIAADPELLAAYRHETPALGRLGADPASY